MPGNFKDGEKVILETQFFFPFWIPMSYLCKSWSQPLIGGPQAIRSLCKCHRFTGLFSFKLQLSKCHSGYSWKSDPGIASLQEKKLIVPRLHMWVTELLLAFAMPVNPN